MPIVGIVDPIVLVKSIKKIVVVFIFIIVKFKASMRNPLWLPLPLPCNKIWNVDLVVVMHVISFDFVDIICVQKKICLQTKSIVG